MAQNHTKLYKTIQNHQHLEFKQQTCGVKLLISEFPGSFTQWIPMR